MHTLKNIPNEFVIPHQSDLETYKNHCILLPLDKMHNVTSYSKKSGKEWRQEFLDFLLLSSKKNVPHKSKKEHIEDVNNNFNNLMNLIRTSMDEFTPNLSLAYPIANCWIIVFYADIFDKSKKLNDIPQEIIEDSYNPIAYSFRNFKG